MDTAPQPQPMMPSPLVNLPSWTQPPAPREDPVAPGDSHQIPDQSPGQIPDPSLVDVGGPPGPPRPGTRAATRTRTSSTGEPGKVDTAKLVAAGLGLAAAAAAWAIRSWGRRRLRRPTGEQLRDIGEPVARFLTRNWDATTVDANLLDFIDAGAATILYLEDGPLLSRDLVVGTGVPTDLQEEEPA